MTATRLPPCAIFAAQNNPAAPAPSTMTSLNVISVTASTRQITRLYVRRSLHGVDEAISQRGFPCTRESTGAASRDRTRDLLITNRFCATFHNAAQLVPTGAIRISCGG